MTRSILIAFCLFFWVGRACALDIPVDLHGFWETRVGSRLQNDSHQRRVSLAETRLQLDLASEQDWATLRIRTDLSLDDVNRTRSVDLEEGDGIVDLREANLIIYPTDFLDLKVGRQVLTWGTGDLLFLNDLFPKDWRSFLIGRDEEYLKAPSDAVKASFFLDLFNLDLVYTPRFDPDRYIRGERISYWSDLAGKIVGQNRVVDAAVPNDWFSNDEWAVRLYKNFRGYEAALYGYDGYWKSPGGMDPDTGRATFPRLSVLGASLRGTLLKGIGNLEAAYYYSGDDASGTDPFTRNSEIRFLAGYEQELIKDLTLGIQYYLERILHHDRYLKTLPQGVPARDEERHVLTSRLTWLLMNQNLTLSLFVFYSPSDSDLYLRPKASYKIDDYWTIEAGGNIFFRENDSTFYGQFHTNNNIYMGLRLGF